MGKKNLLKQNYDHYDFSECLWQGDLPQTGLPKSFILKIRVDERDLEGKWTGKKILVEFSNQLTLSLCRLPKEKKGDLTEYEEGEQYFVYADEEGAALFLEAKLHLCVPDRPAWEYMTLGLPLRAVDGVGKPLYLLYTGVKVAWIVDGEIVNENYPVGELCEGAGMRSTPAQVAYSADISALERTVKWEEREGSMQYYSPRGYNTWAGDVIPFYRDGTYHLIYLLDRHHHGNRFGGGAHSFAHLTTGDFIAWEDHGALFELEEEWQSVGTGTMFFYEGKYYFTFGWHTDRVIPTERTAGKLFKEQLEEYGETRAISYEAIEAQGLFPSGANYALSEDGIRFQKTDKQFHFSENPSVYASESGLTMYGGYGGEGEWFAPTVDGPWRLVKQGFPPVAEHSAMRNTSECPSFLAWRGYEYFIVGGSGFWQRKAGEEYVDMAAQGYDVYDGLFVPMATKIWDDRAILAGWANGMGWGSFIVHRELVQGKDGRLGMRWLSELCPDFGALPVEVEAKELSSEGKFALEKGNDYYIEGLVDLGEDGRLALQFSGEGPACELRFDSAREEAQVNELCEGEAYAKTLEPAYIAIPKNEPCYAKPENLPSNSANFCLARVDCLKGACLLRVRLRYEPKTGSAVLDCEIAGERTLVSYRKGLRVNALRVALEKGSVNRLKIARIEE